MGYLYTSRRPRVAGVSSYQARLLRAPPNRAENPFCFGTFSALRRGGEPCVWGLALADDAEWDHPDNRNAAMKPLERGVDHLLFEQYAVSAQHQITPGDAIYPSIANLDGTLYVAQGHRGALELLTLDPETLAPGEPMML